MSVVYETGPGIQRRYAIEFHSRVTGTWLRIAATFADMDDAKGKADDLALTGDTARVIDTEAGDES